MAKYLQLAERFQDGHIALDCQWHKGSLLGGQMDRRQTLMLYDHEIAETSDLLTLLQTFQRSGEMDDRRIWNLEELLFEWNFKNLSKRAVPMMEVIPAAVVWSVWLERNQRTFGEKDVEMEKIITGIKMMAFRWVSQLDVFKDVHLNTIMGRWKHFIYEPP
ncbi:hypothetical protein BVC80_8939g7 [Macleaya cordata]|uniref:Uncharacterized protein n=1 Tax=Macleaya cordata TaxID=56857 RepID=A0A200R869_MACCD|nr:hypothetical protein BVC80_8939g7 [Macleaya cordata]